MAFVKNGTTDEDELVRLARQLQREVTQRRKLRRHLKACEANIRLTRKQLAAHKAHMEGRRPDAAPSRLTNGATAIGVSGERPEAPVQDVMTTEFI